jgi:hypothetical protein
LYELASWFPEHVSRLVLIAGQVGSRQAFWFSLTDDMLDLDERTTPIPAELSKNKRDHRVYLTSFEVALFREQLLARAPGTRLVFPTATGKQWDRSRFREQVWTKSLAAAVRHDREQSNGAPSVFEGFTFHMLRHTAGSLMARAGMDPAVASERLGHTDGGALLLRTYRHLYEGEKRTQAARLEELIRMAQQSGRGRRAHLGSNQLGRYDLVGPYRTSAKSADVGKSQSDVIRPRLRFESDTESDTAVDGQSASGVQPSARRALSLSRREGAGSLG